MYQQKVNLVELIGNVWQIQINEKIHQKLHKFLWYIIHIFNVNSYLFFILRINEIELILVNILNSYHYLIWFFLDENRPPSENRSDSKRGRNEGSGSRSSTLNPPSRRTTANTLNTNSKDSGNKKRDF